jgi:hypothetical protein
VHPSELSGALAAASAEYGGRLDALVAEVRLLGMCILILAKCLEAPPRESAATEFWRRVTVAFCATLGKHFAKLLGLHGCRVCVWALCGCAVLTVSCSVVGRRQPCCLLDLVHVVEMWVHGDRPGVLAQAQ